MAAPEFSGDSLRIAADAVGYGLSDANTLVRMIKAAKAASAFRFAAAGESWFTVELEIGGPPDAAPLATLGRPDASTGAPLFFFVSLEGSVIDEYCSHADDQTPMVSGWEMLKQTPARR